MAGDTGDTTEGHYRMNLCQIITPSKIAGAERSTMSLCEHLGRAGHRVRIGCKAGSPVLEAMRSMGLDAHPLAISGKANLLAPFRVAAFARRAEAAVLHSQLSTAALHCTGAGRLLGLPTVAHVRALNSAFCYRFATRIIAVSGAVRDHLTAQGIPAGRVDVVYNGVDPARYYLPCSREAARERLGIPADAVLAGVVAHLTAKKGHAGLVEAFSRIAARQPRLHLLFVGEGEERRRLEAQIEQADLRGRVLFAGFQSDVLS
ncbi:MAG: glycosyltransferase, partial [Armatimonadetes bacterium]|nr:glycosyltransferase [Armatimonadota bacterium]